MAAPVPKASNPLSSLAKYLLDDTDGVLLFNLKEVRASPLYVKGLKKQAEGLLTRPEAQSYLKDLGVNPLEDIDHVLFCSGAIK